MKLTPLEIQKLIELIDLRVDEFIANNVGSAYLTPAQRKRLADNGIEVKENLSVDMSFKLGMLSDMIGRKAQKMSFADMVKELKAKKYLPLTYNEQEALGRVKYQAYNEIRGLGNRMGKRLGEVLIEADQKRRAKYEGIIKETADYAIQNRLSASDMASMLGHATGDWARDFDRMSDYILHDAHDHGRAYGIIRRTGGKSKVFKRVFDMACPHCVRLYLTNGPHSEPKQFEIGELMGNGSNIGKKVAEWKPVIGPTHPWCRCEMGEVPMGAKWNPSTHDWDIEMDDQTKRIASLIRVVEIPD